ncbi:MAG: serine hydrolase [Bacteroidales bacterium]|jgi:CubicO group peptidase (beta-lactamase class C family)|nr:serine hydrolase [Bacteroidales bacterium]
MQKSASKVHTERFVSDVMTGFFLVVAFELKRAVALLLVVSGLILSSCEKSDPEMPDPAGKETPVTPDDDNPSDDARQLTLSEKVLNFTALSPEAQTIGITSNTAWQVTIEQTGEWLSVSPSSGNGDGSVSVTAAANIGNARTAIVTVSGEGVKPKAVVVSQEKAPASASDNTLQSVSFTGVNAGITTPVSGVFNDHVIYATLPEGVNIEQLKISFSIPQHAKLFINNSEETSPSSPVNCSGAVSLRVQAVNGNSNTYTLLVKNGNKDLDNYLYAFMKTYSIPGLSVSVMRNETVIYSYGVGFADRENRTRVTPDHLFRLASISKQFTAVCIMKLAENGLLNLDQNVFGAGGVLNDEFPGVTGNKATVTPRHFLQHRSGWISNPDPMFTEPYMNQTLDELISYMLGRAQTYDPGTTFSYYNLGFGVLGKIIEKITGKTYEQYLKELLLDAGISDIHVGGNTRQQKRSNECVYYPQSGYSAYDNNMPLIAAAGGLIASTSQMMRFLASFDGLSGVPDILNAATRSEMFTPLQYSNGWYALGWRMKHTSLYPGGYYHDGNLAGTATMWCGGVNGGYSAAILCNSRSYITGFDTALYVLLADVLGIYGVPR